MIALLSWRGDALMQATKAQQDGDSIAGDLGPLHIRITGRELTMLTLIVLIVTLGAYFLWEQHRVLIRQHEDMANLMRATLYVQAASPEQREALFKRMSEPPELRAMMK